MHQGIRERESLESVRRLSSGEKQNNGDGGNISFAAGLASRTKTERVARDNLDNAIALTQYQMSSLQTVDAIVSRMSDLAYKAADFMSTSSERDGLNREFQALSKTLSGISDEKQADQILFDPMASKYISDFEVKGTPTGGAARTEFPDSNGLDIDAYRGTVKLWWLPYNARDRIQMFQGNSMFFDSGEYQSKGDSPWNNGTRPSDNVNGTMRSGDYFEVDFGAGEVAVRPDSDNRGNANAVDKGKWNGVTLIDEPHPDLGNYPKTQAPVGDSSILKFVVNDTQYPAENLVVTRGGTSWKFWIDVERKAIFGPEALTTSEGLQYQMQTKGFNSLSGLSLTDSVSAADALGMAMQEQDNLRYQMGKVATDFSSLSLNRDYLSNKALLGANAVGRIRDTNMSTESVRLAKNMLLHSVTERSLIHSQLSSRKIFDLLF